MKKILAVLVVISVIFAFAGCASKEYEDTVVTIPVTDENGQGVTDDSGNIVTEIVAQELTESSFDESDADGTDENTSASSNSGKTEKKASSSTTTTKKSGGSSEKESTSSANKTTAASSQSAETTAKGNSATTEAAKKNETTTESTTAKPKKRKVTVQIVLPYYNNQETNLSVNYKADGDKKYTRLEFENPNDKKTPLEYETVKLDGKTVKTYDLGELKGEVTVKIAMTGVDISGETVVIPADESTGALNPYTGIEMMQGEDF